MNESELDLLVALSYLKTTVNLFLIAFEKQGATEEMVNAFYIVKRQIEELESCVKNIRVNSMV